MIESSFLKVLCCGTAVYGFVRVLIALKYFLRRKHAQENALTSPVDAPDIFDANYFKSEATGLWLYHTQYKACDTEKGYIYVVHGWGEHCGRYSHIIRKFNKLGLTVFTMDHVGHGRSEGDRGYVERFSHYVSDMTQFIYHETKRKREIGKPVFLYAHSMGSLVSLSSIVTADQSLFNGIVVTGPAVMPHPDVAKPALVAISSFLSVIFPHLEVQALPVNQISHEQSVVEQYKRDPLVYHGNITARWGSEILSAMAKFKSLAQLINRPLFVLHGEDDLFVSPEAGKFLYREASSQDKRLETIPGAYHELINEPNRHETIEKITKWIKDRM